MSDEIKDRNIRDIRELARAVSDELSRENPKYIDSLRDHFAGLVLNAFLSAPIEVQKAWVETARENGVTQPDAMSGAAYEYADAMLRARENGQ